MIQYGEEMSITQKESDTARFERALPYHNLALLLHISGDVMGPGLTNKNMGLWNTLDKSSGQGETYIFDFALDLYWLKYLKSTAQLPLELMKENLASMNKGRVFRHAEQPTKLVRNVSAVTLNRKLSLMGVRDTLNVHRFLFCRFDHCLFLPDGRRVLFNVQE